MRIKVNHNNEKSTEHDFSQDEIVIGRSNSADLRIVADGVSRRHARIFCVNDKIMIEDLGSSNGTFIDSNRIEREEFTSFFPVFLGPLISLHLLDETGSSKKTTLPKKHTGTVENILNARARSASDEKTRIINSPLPVAPQRRESAKKAKSPSLVGKRTGVFALICASFYYFLLSPAKEPQEVSKAKPAFQKVQKNATALPYEEGKECQSPIVNCEELHLSPKDGESLVFQGQTLTVRRNQDFAFRRPSSKFKELNQSEKNKIIALETFLRQELYSPFLASDAVSNVEIKVFSDKSKKREELLTLSVTKKESKELPSVRKAKVFNFLLYRDGRVERVLAELSKGFDLKFDQKDKKEK